MLCAICYDDLNLSNQIFTYPDKSKLVFCLSCAKYMIDNNFSRYIKEITDADCEKSLKTALSQPIPLYLTIDSFKKSKQIEKIIFGENIIECKLLKTITDEQLQTLNKQLEQIKIQIDNNNVFDYLETIKELITQYNLV